MNTQQVLEERQTTHGDFTDNASLSQQLKSVIRNGRVYHDMTAVQKEALDMIVHKIARVVSGHPNYIDAWKDIAGYSQLVIERLKDTPGALDVEQVYKVMV